MKRALTAIAIALVPMSAQADDHHMNFPATIKAAMIERADALTKCSAFLEVVSIHFIMQEPKDYKNYAHASNNMREDIIIASMLVTMANVSGADPTSRYEDYRSEALKQLPNGDEAGPWYLSNIHRCNGEMDKSRQLLVQMKQEGR